MTYPGLRYAPIGLRNMITTDEWCKAIGLDEDAWFGYFAHLKSAGVPVIYTDKVVRKYDSLYFDDIHPDDPMYVFIPEDEIELKRLKELYAREINRLHTRLTKLEMIAGDIIKAEEAIMKG